MKRTNSDVMSSVVLSLCESIDSPRSLAAWLCFKYNQDALLELPMPSSAENDSLKFSLDYFITEYLSKYTGLKTSFDLKGSALGKWTLTEQLCKSTNERFKSIQLRPFTGRAERALFRAQRKIAAVLGTLRYSIALADCRWGPGATFDLGRNEATPDKKMSVAISVTVSALPLLKAVVESEPHWAAVFLGFLPEGPYSLLPNCFNIVRGSRLLTVPKTAKTDRVIAAEPTGNSFLQQGVHSYIRRRLKRFGVDLDDQSINQRHAQDAYTRGLSTLDLSAASDTISSELVYHLLPLDWAIFLDLLRSPETLFPESPGPRWVRTEKFASMGNAFCFELETLIFWALASSVDECFGNVESVVSVYGDDLIVPREAYDSVVEILTVCGFMVNMRKSYREGNFFESCGKHYHRGLEVTPAYQKKVLTHPSELIRAHNRLIRFGNSSSFDIGYVIRPALRILSNAYPLRPFPRIPYGTCEDGGFLRPLSEFSLDKNHGYRCHVLDFIPAVLAGREDALYAYHLRRFHSRNQKVSFEGVTPYNPLPDGGAGNTVGGAWRTKVRWISEASTRESEPSCNATKSD